MVRKTFTAFLDDQCMMLSAALAFYTALSFAPALILAIWIGSLLGEGTQERMIDQVALATGQGGADVARIVLENVGQRPSLGSIAGLVALFGILLSATTLFAQVQQAMNLVWHVRRRPGSGFVKGLLRKRLISFLMLLFVLCLLLAAVLASTVLLSVEEKSASPGDDAQQLKWLNTLVSLVMFTLGVAAIFKFLPDVIIAWRTVWVGSLLTGGLLVVGKYLIGLYLSRGALSSAYGASGALFVLLMWVYFSWAIMLLGAEFTQAWAELYHHRIRPDEGAVAIERSAREH